jgi:predicted SAM-dependent methyltransferase
MQNKKPLKIDLGAGVKNKKTPLEEWTHLDCFEGDHIEIVCDFAEIPLEDGEADEIFSGDTIEHIRTDLTDKTLREWNRILKIGGIFSGRCPNLHSTMVRYAKNEITMEHAIGALYGSQEDLTQQHYITYTPKTLKALLEKYGFGCIDFSESPGSKDPQEAWWIVWTCIKLKNI